VTHAGGPHACVAKASGYPPTWLDAVAAATSSLVPVDNIKARGQPPEHFDHAGDLTGISPIEQAFAIILAAGRHCPVSVALGISERRQKFATMDAIGAPLSRIAHSVDRGGDVLAVGSRLAVGLAAAVGMTVAILQHVFDPPPDTLPFPGVLGRPGGRGDPLRRWSRRQSASRGIRRLRLG